MVLQPVKAKAQSSDKARARRVGLWIDCMVGMSFGSLPRYTFARVSAMGLIPNLPRSLHYWQSGEFLRRTNPWVAGLPRIWQPRP